MTVSHLMLSEDSKVKPVQQGLCPEISTELLHLCRPGGTQPLTLNSARIDPLQDKLCRQCMKLTTNYQKQPQIKYKLEKISSSFCPYTKQKLIHTKGYCTHTFFLSLCSLAAV